MEITLDRYPEGRQKALTMSYDDGIYDDIHLIEIFNKNGIKGTFHINGGLFWKKGWKLMSREDVLRVYRGHEISCHGFEHKRLTSLPDEGIINEIIRDRQSLEDITGTPIRGMSYAFGDVDDRVERIIRALGMEYARVVQTTGKFDIPASFLRWEGTCHHGDHLMERGEEFLKQDAVYNPTALDVWISADGKPVRVPAGETIHLS